MLFNTELTLEVETAEYDLGMLLAITAKPTELRVNARLKPRNTDNTEDDSDENGFPMFLISVSADVETTVISFVTAEPLVRKTTLVATIDKAFLVTDLISTNTEVAGTGKVRDIPLRIVDTVLVDVAVSVLEFPEVVGTKDATEEATTVMTRLTPLITTDITEVEITVKTFVAATSLV